MRGLSVLSVLFISSAFHREVQRVTSLKKCSDLFDMVVVIPDLLACNKRNVPQYLYPRVPTYHMIVYPSTIMRSIQCDDIAAEYPRQDPEEI